MPQGGVYPGLMPQGVDQDWVYLRVVIKAGYTSCSSMVGREPAGLLPPVLPWWEESLLGY